jgi:hypothetical protein
MVYWTAPQFLSLSDTDIVHVILQLTMQFSRMHQSQKPGAAYMFPFSLLFRNNFNKLHIASQ